ncbi:MAG: hypothetical protein ABIO24_00280 [Saprospiraceae bacterium]
MSSPHVEIVSLSSQARTPGPGNLFAPPTGSMVSLSLFPERNLVIAAMTNVTNGSAVDPLVLQVAEAFTP